MRLHYKLLTILTIVISLTFPAGLVAAAAVSSPAPAAVSRNYLIKLHNTDTSSLAEAANNLSRKFAFSADPQFQNIYGFSSPAGLDFLRQKLAGSYDYLEIDQPVVAKESAILVAPNDPGFTTNPADTDHQWALPKVGFTSAWTKTTGSEAVVVAIIDTGVDETHKDLGQAKFATGINIINGAAINPKDNSDNNGHGTLVAGIIAATPNNGTGIVGTNWKITLLPVKALNGQGSGTSSDISQSIVWAADHGANIINMSLGGLGFGHDTALANAVAYAFNKNVLIIAAAGNDVATTGGNLDQNPVFPICDDNGKNMILGVTATDSTDRKPDFANYGKACVDVSAPGQRILSTINHDPATGAAAPNAYAYASGTSLSVPYVAGQAALLKALYPLSTNQQLRDRIISTADNIDRLNRAKCGGSCNGLLGSGRINVADSIAEAITTVVEQGDLAQAVETGVLYYINGGKRQPVSAFVKTQRFAAAPIKRVALADLADFPEGTYAEPFDGTLIKQDGNPTVYSMSKGLRLPITFQVFQLYHFGFADIHTLSGAEVNSWITGSFLTPPEGTLVRTAGNPTVYWTVNGVLHPVNYGFYIARGLNIFPVVYVSDNDLKNFSKGDAYVR